MDKIFIKRSIRKSAGKALTFLLLLFYVLLTARVETLHKAFHDPELTVSHSFAQEKDPCHIAIYHNADRGCDHETHLVATDKCQICNFAIHADQSLITAGSDAALHPSEQFICYGESLENYWAVLSSSRAPPALS